MSWISSASCLGPGTLSGDIPIFQRAQEWLAYIFFAECPQHSISFVVHIAFLLAAPRISQKFDSPLDHGATQARKLASGDQKKGQRANLTFSLTLILTACRSAALVGIAVWGISAGSMLGWNSALTREEVFTIVQALAWFASFLIVLQERRRCITEHPMSLRVWWVVVFLLAVLQLLGALFRLTSLGLTYDLQLMIHDIFSLFQFVSSLYLLIIAIRGTTGVHPAFDSSVQTLNEPLLTKLAETEPASTFAKANLFMKLTFSWLNPLLDLGFRRSLEVADVPQLAPGDNATSMYALFQKHWPQQPGAPHPVRSTLIKCFWREVLFTGFLQLIRCSVVYIGPLLIQYFTNFAKGERVSQYDGYVLVLLLLAAKSIEVLASHHYNFWCYKLGNNIRTAVVTTVYRKGLRLSSSARQAHGVGQITNYMVVDAQQLSDSTLQMHLCWSLPLQVALAVIILFKVIGVAAFGGLATMILIVFITGFLSNRQRNYQSHIMKSRDTRMTSINEVLNYIKVIKLQAWEDYFRQRVQSFRRVEFGWLTKFVYASQGSMFTLWNTLPLVSTITFASAVYLYRGLTSGKVFTAAATFRVVQEPIRNFPQTIMTLSQAFVALERLDKFMQSAELEPGIVIRAPASEKFSVTVERGCFAWEEKETRPVLSDINVNVRKGSLVTIVGTVGSGKSSLLAALLGEMVKVSGVVKIGGSTAYVSQTAWIQNATIQENILFGAPMELVRYHQVLKACALELDLAVMEHGDQTEIGERGINLSGGQKQRIQLARAVYQNCDVYLFDDIFSAVDAHTGSHLFKECIIGALAEKTILLVTHQVEFLHGADLILVMRNGKIAQSGKYEEILQAGTEFGDLVAAHKNAMGLVKGDQSQKRENDSFNMDSETIQWKKSFERGHSIKQLKSLCSADSFHGPGTTEGPSKLIGEEHRETGHVNWRVYWLYLTKAFGWPAIALLILNQALWQGLLLGCDYWLANEIPQNSQQVFNRGFFVRVYVALSASSWVCVLFRTMMIATLGLKSAQIFFQQMLHSICRAPMSFFDTTPSGRILSRFSADQTNLDILLPFFFGGFLGITFAAIGVIIVTCVNTWPIILLMPPMAWIYYWCQEHYISSSREITRLDSITKAPLIYHFSETVAGIETIRCFKKEEQFSKVNLDRINANMKMDFHNNSANEWLGFRLESMGTSILVIVSLLFVVLPENMVRPEYVGLSLSYALALNVSLYWTVWLYCTVENKMVSVERIRQYTDIPREAELVIDGCLPSHSWPKTGRVMSRQLKLRYRPNTPLVLRGVTFTVEGGEKVGIVGRTGSGKSTLIQAIFRLVEPCGGQILIDGVDITTLGLHDLRSRIGIIPQEPVLFEGTIRSNIDPLGVYTDEEIWKGLEKCQLAEAIRKNDEKLDAPVVEYGSNWSMGQRQLLCFGRALLKHCRVLFLDEATASVDAQTDGLIQQIIREEFVDCTVISIAHRIPTVMDSDKVLVMDAGRVEEFDRPSNLLQNSATLFSALVQEYATRSGKKDEAS